MSKGKTSLKAAAAPLSMADRDGWIWHDGKLVEWRSATTHVLTHSLHYGLAVFEGVRAYKTEIGTAIFRLKEHTDRLFASAHIYLMKIPYTRERLMEAQREVVRANGHEGLLRPPDRVLRLREDGRLAVGAKVHVAIAAWPWGAYLGPEALSRASASRPRRMRAIHQRNDGAPRCRAPTRIRCWRRWKRRCTAMTRACSSM